MCLNALGIAAATVYRDRGATLRLEGGGGGHKTLYLLTLYNFKNIGGHVPPPPPLLCGPWCKAISNVFCIASQIVLTLSSCNKAQLSERLSSSSVVNCSVLHAAEHFCLQAVYYYPGYHKKDFVVVWVTVRVCSVVLRRTVVDVDWRFDNLSGSHHQSRVLWWWLPLRLSKRQSTSTTVLLRTTLQTRTITQTTTLTHLCQTFHCYKKDFAY